MSDEVHIRLSAEAHLPSQAQATITPPNNQSPKDNISCPESRSADTGAPTIPTTVLDTVLERHINFALRSYPESRIARNVAELLHPRALLTDQARPATTPPLHKSTSRYAAASAVSFCYNIPQSTSRRGCARSPLLMRTAQDQHIFSLGPSARCGHFQRFQCVPRGDKMGRYFCMRSQALLSLPRRRDKELGTCHFAKLAKLAKEGGPAITADSALSTLQLVSPDSAALTL